MKKYIAYGVAALALVSCSNEVLIDDAKSEAQDIEITFEPYANRVTKAENSTASYAWAFFNHHDDFDVYGYKNTSTSKVFDGDDVTVTVETPAVYYTAEEAAAENEAHLVADENDVNPGESGYIPTYPSNYTPVTTSTVMTPAKYKYSYSPARFWDKAATSYEYYAAAPANADWTFVTTKIVDASTQDKGYFTTTASLAGSNLSTSTTTTYIESFKSVADVDKMIAAPCGVVNTNFGSTVQFHFNHILSRLNVTIKKDAVLEDFEVKMKNLQVACLYGNGNFSEATDADQNGSNTRWNTLTNPIVYTAVANTIVEEEEKYVLQSLVVPQDAAIETLSLDGSDIAATPKPYLVLQYSIKLSDTVTEDYTVYYNLADAFGKSDKVSFNEGWQNTLKINLKPEKIEFCADVATWADHETYVLDVK